MNTEHWVRFTLSADVTVTVSFTSQPSLDDLAALQDYLAVHIRALKRAEEAAGQGAERKEGEG